MERQQSYSDVMQRGLFTSRVEKLNPEEETVISNDNM